MFDQEFKFEVLNISNSPNSFNGTLTLLSFKKFPLDPETIVKISIDTLKDAFGIQAELVAIKSAEYLGMIYSNDEVSVRTVQEDPYNWTIHWYSREKLIVNLNLDLSTDFSLGC